MLLTPSDFIGPWTASKTKQWQTKIRGGDPDKPEEHYGTSLEHLHPALAFGSIKSIFCQSYAKGSKKRSFRWHKTRPSFRTPFFSTQHSPKKKILHSLRASHQTGGHKTVPGRQEGRRHTNSSPILGARLPRLAIATSHWPCHSCAARESVGTIWMNRLKKKKFGKPTAAPIHQQRPEHGSGD